MVRSYTTYREGTSRGGAPPHGLGVKLFKLLARLTLEGRWLAVARHPVSPSRMPGSIPDETGCLGCLG